MPQYPHILSEIARTPWAIMPSSLRAIVGTAEGKLSAADYPNFHAAAPEEQRAVSAELGEKSEGTRLTSIRNGIGIMQINGPIVPRGDAFTDMSGLTSIDRMSAELSALAVDPSVRHVLLVMDSPGGAITGISEFASMVEAMEKPVTAYVYGNAASAAYWIASAADEIIAGATGMVGSIGVVMSGRKLEDGEWELVNSDSPNKRPDPETTEGRAELKRMLNGLADVFVETVARNRNTTPDAVKKDYGRGGMVLPKDALKVGMIDGVSTLADYLGELISGRPVSKSPTKLIDNPPLAGGKEKEQVDASAETSNREDMMNLAEFLKEHPEASAEIDEIKAQALSAGREAGKLEATTAVNERNAQASAILASDSYPATIKGFASGVLSGKNSPEELKTAVIVFDAMKAEATITAAQGDSTAAPATPPQTIAARSTDGVLRTPADIDAEAAALKAGR